MASIGQEDPRLAALADPALEAAGDRIEAYCGIDEFIATGPVAPGAPGASGGGPATGGELPADFPSELIPEGAEVLIAMNVQGIDSITYDLNQATDDVVAFYKDLLGAPTAELPEPRGALWVTDYEGASITVTVAETDTTTTQVNITLG